jgi:hypothetical protein
MHLFDENVHFQSIEFSVFFVIEWSKCFLKDKKKMVGHRPNKKDISKTI